jgi:hypothetical protein
MATTFAVLLPFSGRYVPPYWAISLAALRWPSNSSHVILHSTGMKRDLARNTLVKSAIKMGAQFCFFIDDDTQIPGDAVVKLHMALNTADDDVIAAGGIYTSKCHMAEPYVYLEEDGGPHWKWRVGDVFPCHSLGTGCMMIKTSVFEKIPEPWFRDIDTVEEARQDPDLDIHPSVGEMRMTDDIYFATKLHKAGFRMLAHGGVLPVHWDQNGNPHTLPRDSYPMENAGIQWFSAFGVSESNLVNPDARRAIELPDGFLSQREAEALHDLAEGRSVLEMGAFKGRSTVAMALKAKSVTSVDWHQGDIHTVGSRHPHIGSTLAEYRKNIAPYPNVEPIVGRFEDVLPAMAGREFDMVLVDGQHDLESVIRDMNYAISFKPAVIAVHDYGLFEVTEGLETFGVSPEKVVDTLAIFDGAKFSPAA